MSENKDKNIKIAKKSRARKGTKSAKVFASPKSRQAAMGEKRFSGPKPAEINQKEKLSINQKSVRNNLNFEVMELPEFRLAIRILEKRTEKKMMAAGKTGGQFYVFSKLKINCARSLIKVLSLFLLIAINWWAMSFVGPTLSYFNDIEVSLHNNFSATDLSLSVKFFRSDGFRTQTQGGWGAPAQGDNPGDYLENNFSFAFPDGITIGSTIGYYAYFASSSHIAEFLPAGGKSGVFEKSHTNPTQTEAGVLAGQTLALALNTGFDYYDPDFGLNEENLADFYANSRDSVCADMTVTQVLTAANTILSGGQSEFGFAEINECVTQINERFVDGLPELLIPDNFISRRITLFKEGNLNFQHILKIKTLAGDIDLCEALSADVFLNENLAYSGKLLDFSYPPVVFSNSADKWDIEIRLPSEAPADLSDKNCLLKYIVDGWQEDISAPGKGFSDQKRIYDEIASGTWEDEFSSEILSGDEETADFFMKISQLFAAESASGQDGDKTATGTEVVKEIQDRTEDAEDDKPDNSAEGESGTNATGTVEFLGSPEITNEDLENKPENEDENFLGFDHEGNQIFVGELEPDETGEIGGERAGEQDDADQPAEFLLNNVQAPETPANQDNSLNPADGPIDE